MGMAGALARVVQAFVAEEPDELALAEGDTVIVTHRADDGWWTGSVDGRKGIFPGNHVELIEDIATPSCGPPAAVRFAYEGADTHEAAVLHGLAAAYEGMFRRDDEREVNGRLAYRHIVRKDKWIAYTPSGWMAQQESNLGLPKGVLLLKDKRCASPDQSTATWHVNPGWRPEPGLRCVGMSDEEAARWEAESNPWGEGAAADELLDMFAQQMALHPDVQRARDKGAPVAERLAAMDRLQALQASGGVGGLPAGLPALKNGGGAPALKSGGGGGSRAVALANGALFIGGTNASAKPHGMGQLLLRDGSVHVGLFEDGVAHGDGVYYDRSGAVHTGSWVTNHRCGAFMVVDPAGALWDDEYDAFGKRTKRNKVPTDALADAAKVCVHCGARYHPMHNFACRRVGPSGDEYVESRGHEARGVT